MINKSLAKSCRSNYALAKPFPHIVIDDFIPEDLALQCYNQMSQHQQWMFDTSSGQTNGVGCPCIESSVVLNMTALLNVGSIDFTLTNGSFSYKSK